jgi:hypothetical protein
MHAEAQKLLSEKSMELEKIHSDFAISEQKLANLHADMIRREKVSADEIASKGTLLKEKIDEVAGLQSQEQLADDVREGCNGWTVDVERDRGADCALHHK